MLELKTYRIEDLFPAEYEVRPDTLRYFTELYESEVSLISLNSRALPRVYPIDGFIYLADGNMRAVFLLLNDIETIDAVSETPFSEDNRMRRSTISPMCRTSQL